MLDNIQDGVLDISNGDTLEISGDVTDYAATDTVSGFSYSSIYLGRSHEYDADGNKFKIINLIGIQTISGSISVATTLQAQSR